MSAALLRFTVRDRLRATVLFALGVVAVVGLYVSVYPSLEQQMAGYMEAMPEALRAFIGSDLASPAGYLQSTIFTILGPVLLVAAAVTFGAGVLAGEEEQGTLALLLSVPVSRLRLALEKLAGIVLDLSAIAVVLLLALLAFGATFELDVPTANLVAGALHLHALALFAAALAFGAGAALGRRAAALGIATGVVVLAFVLDGIAGLVEVLGWLEWVSPFAWYGASEPVVSGVAWGRLALLYGAAAAVAAAGVWRFTRRDLT